MTSTLQPPQAPESRRAARHHPPAGRGRRSAASSGGSGGSKVSGPRGSRLNPKHIGVVIGLMVGGAVMLVVAALGEMNGTRVPLLTSLAEVPLGDNPRLIAPRTPPPATPGSCLSWRRPDAADAETVDCATPHLFEQAGAVELVELAGATLPDNQKFRELVNERCTPLVTQYLGGKYDPNGAFRAGALKPSAKRWSDGDRSLRCGLQRFSRSGVLYPISGKVAEQDQADIRPPGTCLGIDGRFIGDPVDCALPHAVESVGFIDLGGKFKKYPAVGDQDEFLQPACTKLAGDYAGGTKTISDKKLSVLWDNLTQESWNGGTRKVACNLAAQLPDKSGFAPITGTVKGPVKVGDRPAPPARSAVPPGAPARPGQLEPGQPMDGGLLPTPESDQPAAVPPPVDQAPAPLPAPAPAPNDDGPAGGLLPGDQLPRDQLPKDLPPVLGGRDDGDGPAPVLPANPLGR